MEVGIIDIGIGNIGSLENIVKKISHKPVLINKVEDLNNFKKIILPGVGKFDAAVEILEKTGFFEKLKEFYLHGGHILGICLGMQLLFDSSQEGEKKGLGFIPGEVKKIDNSNYKVPHMGWNTVSFQKDSSLLENLEDKVSRFYFVHSYYCQPKFKEDILLTTNYVKTFVSAVEKDNVIGAQFHPEKSHKFGIQFLKNFMDKPC